jgi:hypothetical protein
VFYIFLFADRLLAWSITSETVPFIFFYEVDYEIGMDLAILVFFFLAGVLEYAITHYSVMMDKLQKLTLLKDAEKYGKQLYKMYTKHVIMLFVGGVVAIILIYLLLILGPWFEIAFEEEIRPLSSKVALLGSIGYIFLTFGMLNSLYLFTLNVPRAPMQGLIYGLIANLIVGLIFSRLVSYEYAVIGQIVGSMTFAFVTWKKARHFFKNLDQYYYAVF